MRKATKKRRFNIVALLIVWIAFGTIDYSLAKLNKPPVFALPIMRYKDGGSVEYFGAGYKVIKYVNPSTAELTPKEFKTDFGSWFMKFSYPENFRKHTQTLE